MKVKFRKIYQSIASDLYLDETTRKLLALTFFSDGKTSENIKPNISGLLIGEPNTGKTSILRWFSKIDKSLYIDGNNITKEKLLSILFENPDFFCIDNFRDLDSKTQKVLENPMKHQFVSNKNKEKEINTSILCATDFRQIYFDKYIPISEQIYIVGRTLQSFDYIRLFLKDESLFFSGEEPTKGRLDLDTLLEMRENLSELDISLSTYANKLLKAVYLTLWEMLKDEESCIDENIFYKVFDPYFLTSWKKLAIARARIDESETARRKHAEEALFLALEPVIYNPIIYNKLSHYFSEYKEEVSRNSSQKTLDLFYHRDKEY